MPSYYQILGLPEGASMAEVKKAYRKLARIFHPDVNPSSDAQARFQQVEEAYRMIISGKATKQSRQQAYEDAKQHAEEQKRQAYRERVRRARAFANRIKEEQEQSYMEALRKGTTWLLLIFFAAGSFFVFDGVYKHFKLQQNPDYTWGVVTDVSTRNVAYLFYIEDKKFEGTIYLRKAFTEVVAPNGMPLETGYQFRVQYNREHPKYNTLDFSRYTSQVAKRYMELAYGKMRQAPKFDEFNDEQLTCFVISIYDEYGADGLAKLYFFSEPFIENFRHNSLKFAFFRKSEGYQNAYKSCLER